MLSESHAHNTIEHIEGGDVASSDNNLMVILKMQYGDICSNVADSDSTVMAILIKLYVDIFGDLAYSKSMSMCIMQSDSMTVPVESYIDEMVGT